MLIPFIEGSNVHYANCWLFNEQSLETPDMVDPTKNVHLIVYPTNE